LVVWVDDVARVGPGRLEAVASELLRAGGATAALILPVGRRRVWAWGSSVRGVPVRSGPSTTKPREDIRVAVGLASPGVGGFAVSHGQALEAARIGELTCTHRWLFEYAEVDMIAMLSTDLDDARRFVRRELGGLAGPGKPTATLRATVKCYLDTERSLSAAAEILHVARNTVAYRVRRAEQLRGQEIGVRRMQLQAALALAEELGDVVLNGPPDRT
jgi:DNA-binding PucR family transcriptional regulator